MIVREANVADWPVLCDFFKTIYRKQHPLQNQAFWEWQFGNKNFGRSFICVSDNNKVVGHVGANFQGIIAWIINVYLEESCRGKGILGQMYDLARSYYPLAATAANEAGLGLYRNMRWIRYHNLVRYVKINPAIVSISTETVCAKIKVNIEDFIKKDCHYFLQPGLKGIELSDGSRAVSQEQVGGLRVLEIVTIPKLECEAWQLGFQWMDYITSWNDLEIKNLESNGWVIDYKTVVPWRLNPSQENYFCDVTFLSEKPLDATFVVKRNYSDHGRIGSL